MKQRYRIAPEGAPRISDADIARHKDARRLVFNYQRAVARPKLPLYKDPKAFIALLIIVLLAIFVAEVVEKEHAAPSETRDHKAPPASEQ
jgi:hypothetical protein